MEHKILTKIQMVSFNIEISTWIENEEIETKDVIITGEEDIRFLLIKYLQE